MISDPVVIVSCDEPGCDYSEEYGLTPTARRGYDERNLEREIKAAGWLIIDENTHICPNCVFEKEEEE